MTHRGAVTLRLARPDDVPEINALAARSIRALHADHYPPAVIETAVKHAYGVDWQLIRDGTYCVAEMGGTIAGAGGWSWRETIAGAHGVDDVPGPPLDPLRDPARIRAFYVEPARARCGVGAALLAASETAARERGFARATLTSTLAAIAFYSAHGYRAVEPFALPMPGGAVLELMLMRKPLA